MKHRSQMSSRTTSPAVAVALTLVLVAAMPAAAQVVTTCPPALETTQLFPYTGSPATFTVPANVNSVRVIAVGADGGERTPANFAGGAGALVEGTFPVTPGQVFTVIAGQSPPGANDFEAGGGGASGAYLNGNLIAIAGGGGGDDNTGNGAGGTATPNASNGGSPAGNTCTAGGLGGTGGAGGQFGEIPPPANCETGEGGAGGGGLNSAGSSSAVLTGTRSGPRGGAACSILGAAGGAGGFGGASGGAQGDGIGAAGGFGICGGGGADNRESGGGGGYSGGGGGPEGSFPGGGGSFLESSATSTVLTAGANGGGSARNGSVRLCYTTRADLAVAKTNTPLSGPNDQPADTVVSGSAISYSIVVANNGGASANGAIVTDPSPTNAICSTASCTASGGATCPAVTGAALLAALQGTGATVPTLPSGGAVTFTLTCSVP